MKTLCTFVLLTLTLLVGCNKQAADLPAAGSNTVEPAEITSTANYPSEISELLDKIVVLTKRYNTEANGVEISEHGVSGQLDDDAAKKMASFANSIIKEINGSFDKPVCRVIGETWYQVPARFRLTEAKSKHEDGETLTFTISHHNCGLHEFDFGIENGIGVVIADRYDSLGILW